MRELVNYHADLAEIMPVTKSYFRQLSHKATYLLLKRSNILFAFICFGIIHPFVLNLYPFFSRPCIPIDWLSF